MLCCAVVCGVPCLQAATAALTDQWYPPVRGTLLLLSKLYRCVDMRIFAGLAQEAVAACTVSVQVSGCVLATGPQQRQCADCVCPAPLAPLTLPSVAVLW